MAEDIFVTQTVLPQREAYDRYIDRIFSSHSLTNQGAHVATLEMELKKIIGAPYVDLCANGTLALQLAVRAQSLQGRKVLTTPFTYVATLSSLVWENCQPLFADIDPFSLCLDPQKAEDCLRAHPDIAGIMPVHVYGNACDVSAFESLSAKYGCRLIYDGAHAFGSRLDGRSLLSFGDMAICSFHATKIFHTVEGGCVVAHAASEERHIKLMRAFGHVNDEHLCLGINAKLTEPHAAMGLALLPMLPEILRKRADNAALYDDLLRIHDNPRLRGITLHPGLVWNHAYYPVVFQTPELRACVMRALEAQRIHPRRYFYPSLTRLPYIDAQPCPVAEDTSERVLCLPMWPDMGEDVIRRVSSIIMENL